MQEIPGAARWMAIAFSREGMISAVSPESEPISGYTYRELANLPVTEILDDATVFRLPAMMRNAEECGAWSGEILHVHRSGRAVPAHGVLTVLSNAGGASPSFLLVSTIVGSGPEPVKEARLCEIGGRLREFAHQLNNPLAVVLGFTQLIMTSPQTTREARTEMERLYSEMRRLVEIVQRLHKYAAALQDGGRQEDTLPVG